MKMQKQSLKYLKDLTMLNAISGQENEVAKYLNDEFEKRHLPIFSDNLGSIFALKKSKEKNAIKVLVAGHMDEVGFIAIKIQPNGMIKVASVGGINPSPLPSSRVLLKTNKKTLLKGVIDANPPHLGGISNSSISDMLFDFGFRSEKEALKAGVYIGAMIVQEGSFISLNGGKRLLAKAFDNRYGIALGLDILDAFKDVDLPFDLYVGGTVQEEVGCRGAKTSSYLIHPDLAIIPDCSPARDSSGDKSALGQLGGGVLIRYIDRGIIANKSLLDFQIEACEKAKVCYQMYESPGSTDASEIHRQFDGILTLNHCICARNIHSPASIIDGDDYEMSRLALIEILKMTNKEKLAKVKEGFING